MGGGQLSMYCIVLYNIYLCTAVKTRLTGILLGKISLMSPIVINVTTRALLAVETKDLLFLQLAHLNNKGNLSNISSL